DMWKATIKGVFAYRLRLVLTGLAVVLGVAFVSGTFVLTDTLTGFFDDVFSQANRNIDWVVNARSADRGGSRGPTFSGAEVPVARFDFKVGDRIKVIPRGPVQEFSVAAIVGFGSNDNLGGATIVAWDLPTTQRELGRGAALDGISGTIKPGANLNQVLDSLGE